MVQQPPPQTADAPGVATSAARGTPGVQPAPIDARGPRFGQALTGSLSLVAFVLDAWPLVVALAAVLAAGAIGGERWHLWAWTYRTLVRPRLSAPTELEDPRPPRFSTALGAIFLSLGSVLAATNAVVWWVAWTPVLVVAAFAILAAATGLCVGCELYVRSQRLRGAMQGASS